MNDQAIRSFVDYHYTANRQLWTCVMLLTDEQVARPFAFSIGSIHNHLVHMMQAEHVWLCRLKAIESDLNRYLPELFPSRVEIRHHWNELESQVRAYLESLHEGDLTRPIQYQATAGETYTHQVFGILMHLVNHGTDHRAQIMALINLLEGPTIEQDYIFYLRR